MTPNLNDLKTRIEYVVNGGKVYSKSASDEHVYSFSNGIFMCSCTTPMTAAVPFFSSVYSDWLPYEEPKSEEKERMMFLDKLVDMFDAGRAISPLILGRLLLDTFALKEK